MLTNDVYANDFLNATIEAGSTLVGEMVVQKRMIKLKNIESIRLAGFTFKHRYPALKLDGQVYFYL